MSAKMNYANSVNNKECDAALLRNSIFLFLSHEEQELGTELLLDGWLFCSWYSKNRKLLNLHYRPV